MFFNYTAKTSLTQEQINKIIAESDLGKTELEIGRSFNLPSLAVYRIISSRKWNNNYNRERK